MSKEKKSTWEKGTSKDGNVRRSKKLCIVLLEVQQLTAALLSACSYIIINSESVLSLTPLRTALALMSVMTAKHPRALPRTCWC